MHLQKTLTHAGRTCKLQKRPSWPAGLDPETSCCEETVLTLLNKSSSPVNVTYYKASQAK